MQNMKKIESIPEVSRISGERQINLTINPDATESRQHLISDMKGDEQQEKTMLKIDSVQQLDSSSRVDPIEETRLSIND